ncbi:MAG: ribosome biogenesis GTP-binding protein YihA/YsxC [Bacteroidetes bacterium]|nr:ribosome biogenesis GTP-binding protein YihA/YsxC [Bacteroidota bacterium]
MQISSATFIASSPSLKICPVTDLPEFAFIGRSNVGKSSLINMITGIKALAKVSGTPGKTRLINHFLINESWFLVDLPGFGFAKTSKAESAKIETMIEGYLLRRDNLRLTFLLIDSRHMPQNIDLQFMAWLSRNQIPFILLFTKADKISKAHHTANPALYRKSLMASLSIDPPFILTSSEKKTGKEEILACIEDAVRGEM